MRHAAPSILCLDLGTTTGWALSARGRIISGSKCFTPGSHDDWGLRFIRFRRELLDPLRGVREVYYEKVRRHNGTDAAHVYGGFLAVLAAWCVEHNISYTGIEVQEWKKSTVGKGNAKKQAVIDTMKASGFAPADENEADALAMLRHVHMRLAA